jgi:hypothetical protein
MLFLGISCSEKEKQPASNVIPEKDSIKNLSSDLVGYDSSYEPHHQKIILNIAKNSADPKDSLLALYKKTAGTGIDSLAPGTYVLNFWYGGSYEDVFVYMQKSGSYQRMLSFCGTVGFTVSEKEDNGTKRLEIINKRNKSSVIFSYDGKNFDHFEANGVKSILTDAKGVARLKEMEIYMNCN